MFVSLGFFVGLVFVCACFVGYLFIFGLFKIVTRITSRKPFSLFF